MPAVNEASISTAAIGKAGLSKAWLGFAAVVAVGLALMLGLPHVLDTFGCCR